MPVNVDAVVFWHVHDAQRAALNITDYRSAIDRVAQTSLREMIGASHLSALLAERKAADEVLRTEIAGKTADWGISVNSVEIRDVAIPVALQDAMSRQAQAEREKEARVILGSAEAAIAAKFVEAARTYAGEPAALHLRAMNIIYETTKERGATILIPTSMVDSMSVALPAAMAQAGALGGKSSEPRTLLVVVIFGSSTFTVDDFCPRLPVANKSPPPTMITMSAPTRTPSTPTPPLLPSAMIVASLRCRGG